MQGVGIHVCLTCHLLHPTKGLAQGAQGLQQVGFVAVCQHGVEAVGGQFRVIAEPIDANALVAQMSTSSPLRSSKLSSFCDGPLGCLSPNSHWRTADGLVLSNDASTV